MASLDRLTGGLLLGVAAGGGLFALSLFEAKAELARLSSDLVAGLALRLRGLGRFDRSERLAAAHKVIVLAGFFESLGGAEMPADVGKLLRGKSAQVAAATGSDVSSERLRALAGILQESDVPGEPGWPAAHDDLGGMAEYYRSLAGRVLYYLEGRQDWSHVSQRSRDRFAAVLTGGVPRAAMRCYEEQLRRLAGDFPEVAFWAGRAGQSAVFGQLLRIDIGMQGVSRILEQITSGAAPDERRLELAGLYRKGLDRPIIAAGEVPSGFVIPSLAEAYVNPRYRVAEVTRSARLDLESWWADLPVRDDLQSFLIGYLTSVGATERPLVVLGQPGSGKSLLTKIVAARLPESDFLVVRVALRDVPADADLQSQIEHAIRDCTGENLTWPALARSRGDALPVVLLDGFDELLQASGIGQTDYLEQVVRFQEREADQGRPVAVLVTTRTAVADRARIPADGAVAVRLEPFSDDQVSRWLGIWNARNGGHLAERGLAPLPAAVALRQRDLASQPLLLLMLALYDAAGNALQREAESLDEIALYERLLGQFAEREIRKDQPGLHDQALAAELDRELLQLSVAAFSMFNRGRQWVSDEELSSDLASLLESCGRNRPPAGFHVPATPAQLVVSRFFFIHQAQAIHGGHQATTSEFLHATFGEYLVARLVMRELADLAATAGSRSRRPAEISFLRALLSFAPLTSRRNIVEFTASLASRMPASHRAALRLILLTAFHGSLYQHKDTSHDQYGPPGITLPARHAAYSANLLILAVLIGGPVTGRELFPHSFYPATDWRGHAMLWRSQFYGQAWISLTTTLSLERIWVGGDRDVRIAAGPWTRPDIDVFWTFRHPPGDKMRTGRSGWRQVLVEELARESYFTCDLPEDVAWHALEPVLRDLDTIPAPVPDPVEATTAFGVLPGQRAMSVTHAMIRLWLASASMASPSGLAQAYKDCLDVIEQSRPEEEATSRNSYIARVLRQLAADKDRLTAEFRTEIYPRFAATVLAEPASSERPALQQWAQRAFADLNAASTTEPQQQSQ